MRRAFLPILPLAFLLLLAGTWLAWQHRYEIDATHPRLTLRELGEGLSMEAGATWVSGASGAPELVMGGEQLPVVQLLPLRLSGPVEFLMFDFAVEAKGLKQGPMPWSDGRLMVEWHLADGTMVPEYLASARENNPAEVPCLVADSPRGPAIPVLRMEHLGSSGSFRLSHCRIDVVRESAWWKVGRWLLIGGWFAWAATVAGWRQTSGLGRPLLAAAVWLFCAAQWAVPGPWPLIRPLAQRFAVNEPAARPVFTVAPAAPQNSVPSQAAPASAAPVQSLGELPVGGSVLLEIKKRILQARPVFHVLLFFGPAFVFALLIGRMKSLFFTGLLAGGIEWTQYLFGFGFDSSDLFDLSFDALGITLALWAHARLCRWWRARKDAGDLRAGEVSAGQAT